MADAFQDDNLMCIMNPESESQRRTVWGGKVRLVQRTKIIPPIKTLPTQTFDQSPFWLVIYVVELKIGFSKSCQGTSKVRRKKIEIDEFADGCIMFEELPAIDFVCVCVCWREDSCERRV